MLDFLSIAFLLCIALILAALAWIDVRTRLLPNTLVLAFATLAYGFHICTLFEYALPKDLLIGAAIGGGSLLMIRAAGNYYYGQDTLGLGDVKLMAAAGLWLGAESLLIALITGALAGVVHGAGEMAYARFKHKVRAEIATFAVPAGPGFIVGILIAALAKFTPLTHVAF